MKKVLLRETLIYAAVLLILAALLHPDLLTDPTQRAQLLAERGNYLHPLIYAGLLYALIGVIRLTIRFIRQIGRKRRSSGK